MQEQVKDEFKNVIDIVPYVLKTLNFHNFKAQISLRDKVNREKYIGSEENWVKTFLDRNIRHIMGKRTQCNKSYKPSTFM